MARTERGNEREISLSHFSLAFSPVGGQQMPVGPKLLSHSGHIYMRLDITVAVSYGDVALVGTNCNADATAQ